MNRSGVLQSSPVQQMMVGSPNWWNMINSMRPPPPHHPSPPNLLQPHYYTPPHPSSLPFSPSPSIWYDNNNQELPEPLSQLLLGRLVSEEEKGGMSHFQGKKMENWEDQMLQGQTTNIGDVKQESSASSYGYGHEHGVEYHEAPKPTWSQMMPTTTNASPNKSCVTTTTLSSNILDFSNTVDRKHPPPDRSLECNSTLTGGALKKARVQPSSTQSTFKVRKEKLGDRITALHQLVSPFGKTDTASVLSEAIGYIRFLQSQVEALSLPYLGSGSPNMRQQQPVQGEMNCLFPEDPGQVRFIGSITSLKLLNDNMKRKGASEQQDFREELKDLRSRGLCLVPLSCTLQVGSDNGADYWAPAVGGGLR